jgi:hypothetical protein
MELIIKCSGTPASSIRGPSTSFPKDEFDSPACSTVPNLTFGRSQNNASFSSARSAESRPPIPASLISNTGRHRQKAATKRPTQTSCSPGVRLP